MEALTGGGQSLEELEQAQAEKQVELIQTCEVLTNLRQATAKNLEQRLVAELKPLAMEKVQFQVAIQPSNPTATGADQVIFLFSPNPGEPLQPLTEIASGGEMSRFLLALQASFSQIDPVGTLVFDEIDVGVSGRVTQAIAEKLYHLSRHHQVLCVTHQAIVAAMADKHLRVSKQLIANELSTDGQVASEQKHKGGRGRQKKEPVADVLNSEVIAPESVRTVVRVAPLSNDQRREELAQLAGGQTAQEAIAFADALLNQAANLRQGYDADKTDLTILDPPVQPTKSRAARK
jgi:DNA repair protein RecN (Recombination protein N)